MESQPHKRPKPRQRSPALLNGFHRERLTNEFLRFYAGDPQFTTELLGLIEQHKATLCALGGHNDLALIDTRFYFYRPLWGEVEDEAIYGESDAVRTFVLSVKTLIAKWNLDVLPGEIGYQTVLSDMFSHCWHPESPVYLYFSSAHEIPYVEGEDRIDRRRPMAVNFEGRWYPSSEPPGEAEDRLVKEFRVFVRSEIHDGMQRLKHAGYQYEDQPEWIDVYLGWLYRRVAYREPFHRIAGDVGHKVTYVERRISELKRQIGIKRLPPQCR